MPANYSSKREHDRKLGLAWAALADGGELPIALDALNAAQRHLHGTIVLPGDAGYNAARLLFNPIFDPHPLMVVCCKVPGDVAVALQVARQCRVGFAVRSGGHCTAGFSANSGMLIDVSGLDDVTIDAVSLTATVGTGCTFGKLNAALDLHGLHVPGGECPDVCIGGYVQGGGYGFTSVTFGMNCDNVLQFQVMLADGHIVIADATHHADLFWAMRGGTGGNFAVLLSVVYQLRPLGDVFGWALAWPLVTPQDLDRARDALVLLQKDYMRHSVCGADMTVQVSLCFQNEISPGGGPVNPAAPLVPYLMIRALYVGPAATCRALIRPLTMLAGCITQWMATTSFSVMNDKLLNDPQGMPYLPANQMPFEDKAARYVERDLTPAEWRAILAYFITTPNEYSYFYIEVYGGAINEIPVDATAFIHRNAAFNAVLDVLWFETTDRLACEQFLRGWIALMQPMWNGHVYQNYPSLEPSNYGMNYWGDARYGLGAVKRKYDPHDDFRFAQQVRAAWADQLEGARPRAVPQAVMAALAEPIQPLGKAPSQDRSTKPGSP